MCRSQVPHHCTVVSLHYFTALAHCLLCCLTELSHFTATHHTAVSLHSPLLCFTVLLWVCLRLSHCGVSLLCLCVSLCCLTAVPLCLTAVSLCLCVSPSCSAGVYVRSMLECNAASHKGTTFTMTKYKAHSQQLPANNISLSSVITLYHRESDSQLVMEAGKAPLFRKQVLACLCLLVC